MTIPASQYQYSIRLFRRSHAVSVQNILLAISAIAIVLRVASAFLQGNNITELPGIYDQISYDSLASRVVDGYGFSFAENHWPLTRAGEPTAHWSFLYTLYLAGIYTLFGHQPLIARVLQAVIVGGVQIYLIYFIAERTFSKTVGLIASGLTAFYIYFIYYDGSLMTEPFYIVAILWSLFLAIRLAETEDYKQNIRSGIGLGIAVGITILLRQVFLLFIPFLFLWIWIARLNRSRSLPVVSTILSLSLIVVCVLPISLYNKSRFGRFVLLNTNSGYAFFWGNHPMYGTQFIPILPSETYLALIPEDLRNLDEAALDQELLRRGIQFIVDDPKRYIFLSLSRIPDYFMFWPSSQSSLISNISRVASFGIMLPFILYGLFINLRKKWMGMGNHLVNLLTSPEGLLLSFILIYSVIHLLTWALIRYRLPVDAVLIPFAAFALADIFERMNRKIASPR